jgi:hypothetical protein
MPIATRAARVPWRLALCLTTPAWPVLVLAAAIMALVGAPVPAALATLALAWAARRAHRRR